MNTEQTNNMGEVRVEQLEPQQVLSIRGTIQIADIGNAMGERMPALLNYIKESGAQPAGPPFVRYYTFGDSETDMETGVPITGDAAGRDRIAVGELPGGTAITTRHTGAHDKLGEAYARVNSYIAERGCEPSSPAWEVYYWIDPTAEFDPSTWDPSTWHTQLVQPIK